MDQLRISSIAVVTFLLITLLSGNAPAQIEGYSAYPRGLRVVTMPRGGESGMRPFNYPAGTTVVVQIESTDRIFIDYDRKSSQIKNYHDNVGTDLSSPHQGGSFRGSEIGSVKYSDDRHAVLVELSGGRIPKPNADSVQVEAEMTFWVAKTKITHRLENILLESGQTIQFGDDQLTIDKVGPPDNGNRPLAIELKSANGSTRFENVRFFDSGGSEIEGRRVSWSNGSQLAGGLDLSSTSAEFHLSQKINTATIELDQWQQVEAVAIPLNIETSIGLTEYGRIDSTILTAELRKLISENMAKTNDAAPPPQNNAAIEATVERMIKQTRDAAPLFLRVFPEDERRFQKGEFDTEANRKRWNSSLESVKVIQDNFAVELPNLLKALIAQNDTSQLVGIRLELAIQFLEAEIAKGKKRLWDEINNQ